jgi:hypothetical protein
MKILLNALLIVIGFSGWGQKAELQNNALDLGRFSEAGSIRFKAVIRNSGSKPLVFLRADAPKNVDVYSIRKTVQPNDTLEVTLVYHPLAAGLFKQSIQFVTNSIPESDPFTFSGSIDKLLNDNLLHCVDFKPKAKGESAEIEMQALHRAFISDAISGVPLQKAEITYIDKQGRVQAVQMKSSNGYLEHKTAIGYYALIIKAPGYEALFLEQYISSRSTSQNYMLTPEVAKTSDKREIDNLQQIQGDTLDNLKYKPNNIVFLIDASGSMKDENKLPLLKKAIIRLTEPLRSSDFISIIAYADDVEILISNKAGNKKTALLEAVNSLKADGITAGAAGLNKAYELILQNYIVGGNNQILLATDGVFRLSATQRKSIEMQAKSIEKPVALSIVALGNDDAAIQMLTTLSQKGNGNLIHLNDASKDKIDLILNEIESRSRR